MASLFLQRKICRGRTWVSSGSYGCSAKEAWESSTSRSRKLLDALPRSRLFDPSSERPPTALQRFEREAHAVAKLRHPGIVAIYGSGETDRVRWLAMEFVPGQSLRDLVQESGHSRLRA